VAEIRIIAAAFVAIGAIFIWQRWEGQDRLIRRIRRARLEELREPGHGAAPEKSPQAWAA
jgi:hypothetical protein